MSVGHIQFQAKNIFLSTGTTHCPRRHLSVTATLDRCRQAEQSAQQLSHSRRGLLASLSFVSFTVRPAEVLADSLSYGNWDGKSAAGGSCAIGEAGDNCRRAIITKDKLDSSSYGNVAGPQAATGSAVAEMSDEYTKATLQVADAIQRYAGLDAFDPSRPKIVKALKQEGGDWASKYARGGNTRKQSARRFYVAYDALLGHLVQSGMAPMPKAKLEQVLLDVNQAKDLMAKGR